jgi:hypothetical protein
VAVGESNVSRVNPIINATEDMLLDMMALYVMRPSGRMNSNVDAPSSVESSPILIGTVLIAMIS